MAVRAKLRVCAKVTECVRAARPWRRSTALIVRLATGGVMTMIMHEAWRDQGAYLDETIGWLHLVRSSKL